MAVVSEYFRMADIIRPEVLAGMALYSKWPGRLGGIGFDDFHQHPVNLATFKSIRQLTPFAVCCPVESC